MLPGVLLLYAREVTQTAHGHRPGGKQGTHRLQRHRRRQQPVEARAHQHRGGYQGWQIRGVQRDSRLHVHTYIEIPVIYIHTYMHACVRTYIRTCVRTYERTYVVDTGVKWGT